MKRLLNSFIIAFSMYSKIPMPACKWDEENMSYAMCFWPWVGAIIGLLSLGWSFLFLNTALSRSFFAVVLVLIPVAVTGGIHLDGLLDTADALSSWQSRERRLEILKDSHAGAFAVITGAAYFLLSFGVYSQADLAAMMVIAPGFMLSRCLSAMAIVTFPKAKADGSVAVLAKGAKNAPVRVTMMVYMLLLAAVMLFTNPLLGAAALAAAAASFGYYYHVAIKNFGGTTGDLAGWFLSICELAMPLAVVIVQFIGRSGG